MWRKFQWVMGFGVLSSFVCVSYATARDGGGASNGGGKSVSCPDERPVILDVYGMDVDGPPADRASFETFVFNQLAGVNPGFAERWRREWERLGDSESWERVPVLGADTMDSFHGYMSFGGCRVDQVAFFVRGEWVSRKVSWNYDALSVLQRRILELHESIYVIGARDYGQLTSTLTRLVVANLLVKAPRRYRLERALFDFVTYPWAVAVPMVEGSNPIHTL